MLDERVKFLVITYAWRYNDSLMESLDGNISLTLLTKTSDSMPYHLMTAGSADLLDGKSIAQVGQQFSPVQALESLFKHT